MNAVVKLKVATGNLRLRDMSNDYDFDSIESLKAVLRKNYVGEHVSILYKAKSSGLLRAVYCSVTEKGEILLTYGNGEQVDFDNIEKNRLI